MCGLAGILRFDGGPIDPDRLARMQRQLVCRGADAQGTYIASPCGLAHTRLAVLDVPGGHQPMLLPHPVSGENPAKGAVPGSQSGAATAESASLAVVFNGEIYNHREVRRRLQRFGHTFTTDHSDTEVLLHGYRQWGTGLPQRLEGMFAFAIYDRDDRSLFLARDRTGKKPLYLRRTSDELLIASTVAGIVAGAVQPLAVDPFALRHYLTFSYLPGTSLWEGIGEVPPASWLRISADGRTAQGVFWQPPPVSRSTSTVDLREAIRRVLDEAIQARLEADVPLGCFLSGGIDSSLVAAIAQRHLARRRGRLKTFSIAMPDARYDESPFAARVAEHIGSDHRVLPAEPDVEDDLRQLIATMGEPLGDSSLLPTYWLSRAAREHVTVALSGDGGDELFAGYDRYRALGLLAKHGWWLRMLPAGLLGGGDQKSTRARFARLVKAARRRDPAAQYLSMIRLFEEPQLRQIGLAGDPIELSDWNRELNPVDAARRWDLQHYLPFDLLRKVDRASMAVALEVRCPMLDSAVYELAAHLPASVLMSGGRAKALLRSIATAYLPREIVNRPKMGFAVPIGGWFTGRLRPTLEKYLLDSDALPELGLTREGIEPLVREHVTGTRDHTQRLFALLALSMWQQWAGEVRDD